MASAFSGGNYPKSHLDSRNDLGYGRSDPKFHTPKTFASSKFPYLDEDLDLDDIDLDFTDEELRNLSSKISGPHDYDHSGGHYDPFYYVAGNTKLSEITVSKGISPIPDLYKNRDGHVGGNYPAKPSSQFGFRTDREIFSKNIARPYLYLDSDEEGYTLQDIADNQNEENLREWIRLKILELI